MPRTRLLAIAAGAVALPVHAADVRPNLWLDALTRCATIAEPAGRLACYDREAGSLTKAINDKQVAIVEQSDVRRSRRELFGVAVPNVKLFDALGAPELSKLDTIVTAVGHTGEGRLTFTTTEGAVWVETEDTPIYSVKPGRRVTLKRGALGSFFAAFDKGASIRVKRTR